MIKNNPVRCAAEGCAFYAVTLGGYCEACDIEAHRDLTEQEWIDENFARIDAETMECIWATCG